MRVPRLTSKVERGLQALSEAAGELPDKDGSVAAARRWLAARLEQRRQEKQGAPAGHQELVEALVARWEAAHDRKYPFAPRDAQAVRLVRGMDDFDPDECLARWDALLEDEWWRRRGIAIPDLAAQWTRLASKTANRTPGSSATSAAARLARRLKG